MNREAKVTPGSRIQTGCKSVKMGAAVAVLTLIISQKGSRFSNLGGSSRTGGDESIYRAELFENPGRLKGG